MADAGKRLAGPTPLTTTASTVYTVPALTTAQLHSLFVCNESGGQVNFTLSIGTDGTGKRLYSNCAVAPYSTFQETGLVILSAAEVLQAYASAGSALTITISGVEST